METITLTRLTDDDREQFIADNQRAFRYGATEEFGLRDEHFEEDGEIISRATIERCIDGGVAYRIREDGRIVGGLVRTSSPGRRGTSLHTGIWTASRSAGGCWRRTACARRCGCARRSCK